jgi:plastocyanin
MHIQLHIGLIFLLSFTGGALQGGSIHGTVTAEVKSQGDGAGDGGSYGSRKYKFLEQVDYSKFRDFVVSIDDIEAVPADGKRPEARVEQKNGTFVPRILPITAGTQVEWPNRDDIFHNVFSISETRPFDLGYYKSKDDAKSVIFEKPGRVDVFCSIHSQMNCIILIMPNPWFSPTDRKGQYEIKDVPAGTYRIKAWHERLPPKYLEITVPENGSVELNITMGLADLPKY